MESAKQQGIMVCFNKTDKTKTSETDSSQNGNEASISRATVSVGQTAKRTYANKSNVTGGSKKQKGEFVRQYDKKYLELGFAVAPGSEQSPRPLCLVCSQILSNDAMKPSKLARHFHSKHNNLKDKPLEYFERLRSNMNDHRKQMKKMTTTEKSFLHTSYLISLQIPKTKKPYTIGAELIKPCILSAAEQILGPEAARKFDGIPLSNNAVQ